MSSRLKTALVIAVLALAGATIGVGARARMRAQFIPYTIQSDETRTAADGRIYAHNHRTHAVDSSGRWRQIRSYEDGRSEETYGDPERGVFKVGRGDNSYYIGAAAAEPAKWSTSFDTIRALPQYVRDDNLLGVPVAVVKVQASGDNYSLMYVAPSLNGDTIAEEVHIDGRTINIYPVSIKLGEPDPAALVHTDKPEIRAIYEATH